ncbi:MAG: hypothetical protein ACYDBV_05570 [Nitrospiria bacterium]
MNIIDTLSNALKFEEKVCLIYQRTAASQKIQAEPESLWEELAVQKEKQTRLIKKALMSVDHGQNASRINLISSREMEQGLKWVDTLYEKLQENESSPSKIHEVVCPIITFELNTIYSPLLKAFDLQFLKPDPAWIPLLQRHIQTMNACFKKHRIPTLASLVENYPFLNKQGDEKRIFSEAYLFQTLLEKKKNITVHLKNGASFPGKLIEFDHSSIRCSTPSLTNTLFFKESILSIQIHD